MTTANAPLTAILFSDEVATAADTLDYFDFGKIRIVRIWAVSEEAQAAHATILREVKVGTAADVDRYAHITNDSDLSDTAAVTTDPDGVLSVGAWAAATVRSVDFRTKTVGNAPDAAAPGTPGGSFPEHSGVLVCEVIHAGTTPTASRVTVGMDYYVSD